MVAMSLQPILSGYDADEERTTMVHNFPALSNTMITTKSAFRPIDEVKASMRAKGLDTAAVKGNDRGAEARPIWIHGITNTPSMNLRLTHPNRKLVEQQFGPVHTCRFPKDTPRSDLVDGTPEWEGKDFPWQRIPEVKDLEALDMYVLWAGCAYKTIFADEDPLEPECERMKSDLFSNILFDRNNKRFGNSKGMDIEGRLAQLEKNEETNKKEVQQLKETNKKEIQQLKETNKKEMEQLKKQREKYEETNKKEIQQLKKQREKDEETNKKEMEQLKKQREKDEETHKNNVDMLKCFKFDVVQMRQTILNEESDPKIKTPPEERNTRNALAHGGNLLADVVAIKEMGSIDPNRSEQWKKAFANLYNLNFDTDVESLPHNMVKCCNMFANIQLVYLWKEAAAAQAAKGVDPTIKQLCERLITNWKGAVIGKDDEDGFLTNEDKKTYDKIEAWYDNIGSGKI
ncbi:hypothetical protein V8E54_004742 [Elaphomyces granulatus]